MYPSKTTSHWARPRFRALRGDTFLEIVDGNVFFKIGNEIEGIIIRTEFLLQS